MEVNKEGICVCIELDVENYRKPNQFPCTSYKIVGTNPLDLKVGDNILRDIETLEQGFLDLLKVVKIYAFTANRQVNTVPAKQVLKEKSIEKSLDLINK